MALPKLNNDTPTYELIIPSTKKSVRFRPFLVKEQKNLLIAMESKDAKQILNSMLSCLDSCVEGINTNDLATFDVDYMFTQIRSKSVGEISEIMTNCANCNHQNKVSVDLSKIDMNAGNQLIARAVNVDVEGAATLDLRGPASTWHEIGRAHV